MRVLMAMVVSVKEDRWWNAVLCGCDVLVEEWCTMLRFDGRRGCKRVCIHMYGVGV